MSVPSVDEDAWARLEPGTAPPLQRLKALKLLKDAGISTAVLMMPLVPGITTTRDSIERTLHAIADAGLTVAGWCVARLDPGVKEFFFAFLEREYPDLIDGYRTLYPRSYAAPAYVREIKSLVRELRPRRAAAT
jgi:DNA repair photolyase